VTAATLADGRIAAASDRSIPVGQRLDRLPVTGLHVAILALCTLGLAADIGEVALSNTFSAIFLAPPYSASRGEVSWLLASVFAGGAVGAPIFGWFADRHGRRRALQTALVVLAASSFAVAFSPNMTWMTLLRFVSGLALGGYPPLTAAFLSDVMPPKQRGVLMMLCGALAFLGAPAMIFLIRWLTPLAPLALEGWRWALIAGAITAAATAGLFFFVPESPRWLAALGRSAEAEKSCAQFRGLAPEPSTCTPRPDADARGVHEQGLGKSGFGALREDVRHVRRAVLLAALYALGPWATIGFPLLSAGVMVQKGFHIGDSLLFAGISMFGSTLGIGAVAAFVDGIGRRLALSLCAAVMAAIGLAFAMSTALTALIILGTAFNLLSAIYSALLALYGAELFPTKLRASATAGAWGVGRLVSALVPIALLPLLGAYGPLAMFGVIAGALLMSLALITGAGPPGLARQAIE
jgi:MFS transporter, putative metabolite:H+ symporter